MSSILGRIRVLGNVPCYCYGSAGRAHPLRCQLNSQSLGRCKVLWPYNTKRDTSYHTSCGRRSWTLHNHDVQRISTFRSISHHEIKDLRHFGLTTERIYILIPAINKWEIRLLSTGPDASSKVEETVRRLKEKHEDRLKEIHKIQDLDLRVKSVIELDQETDKAVQKIKEKYKIQYKKDQTAGEQTKAVEKVNVLYISF